MTTEIESIQSFAMDQSSIRLTDMLVGNPEEFLQHIKNHQEEVRSWV